MKNKKIIFVVTILSWMMMVLYSYGCKTPELIANKTGLQLWNENCMRCHNNPTPADYSDDEWDVVIDHMRVKANLTDKESDKITEFLKSAN